tara:strand:+ start:1122 stop:1274 length:153 start_codon:yes stop_codon:yes gene_type:complete
MSLRNKIIKYRFIISINFVWLFMVEFFHLIFNPLPGFFQDAVRLKERRIS